MIPAEILFVDRFPLTSGGKVDRQALAARALPPRRGKIAGPGNGTEETVARVWQEVLRLERIGIDQNFFDLGGHSLLATRVLARLRGAFEMDLPLRLMFEQPTVAGLAAEIARRAASREESVVGR
jgi:acyl carrier protein